MLSPDNDGMSDPRSRAQKGGAIFHVLCRKCKTSAIIKFRPRLFFHESAKYYIQHTFFFLFFFSLLFYFPYHSDSEALRNSGPSANYDLRDPINPPQSRSLYNESHVNIASRNLYTKQLLSTKSI